MTQKLIVFNKSTILKSFFRHILKLGYKSQQNIIWQVRCAITLILHELFWRMRIRILIQFTKRNRLGTVLRKLYTDGVAVIPNYYSNEEISLIDQYCSMALKESENKPEDEISISRRGGAVRLKQLQRNYKKIQEM